VRITETAVTVTSSLATKIPYGAVFTKQAVVKCHPVTTGFLE